MRSFKLFRKSKNIMPSSPEKLTREDKKRITENVENRLGLNDARPRLGGGPVMAAMTAMAMIAVMVAGGIYIAGKDEMVVDPATNSFSEEIVNGDVEIASDYIHCDMYLSRSMTDVSISIPYIYSGKLPNITVTGFSGSNTENVTVKTTANSLLGDTSSGKYDVGLLQLQLNIPWAEDSEVIIDTLIVSIEGIGSNISIHLSDPLRFHCVDAVKDDNMQISVKRTIRGADTIQNDVKITSTEYRRLESIRMLTGESLICYQKNNTSYAIDDRTSDNGKVLEFCNIITEGGDFRLDKSAELCYIYANALLEVSDGEGNSYYVIAEVENSNGYNGLSNVPDTDKLKEDILSSGTAQQGAAFEMDSLAGNVYSQEVIDTLESELNLAEVDQVEVESADTYITVDSVLCDGVTANILLLIEPSENYTGDAKDFRDTDPDIKFYSSENKELDIGIRKSVYDSERDDMPIKCISVSVNMNDLGDELRPTMYISMQQDSSGISVDLSRNINMNEYRSADGESVYLSECAFYSSYECPTSAADNGESFALINYSGNKSTYTAKKFGLEYYETFITGSIEYNGKTYTKKKA